MNEERSHCPIGQEETRDGRLATDSHQAGPPAHLRLAPARTPSIADNLILKTGDLFFLCQPNGDVPLSQIHATGLYYHDCRYLDGYELRIAGHSLETLVSTAGKGHQALIELTNPELIAPGGAVVAPLETVGVKWTRTLDPEHLALHERLQFRNFGNKPLILPVSLAFRAGFQDIFAVRSLDSQPRGTILPPRSHEGVAHFEYHGADGLGRSVTVRIARPPVTWNDTTATFTLALPPRGEQEAVLTIAIAERQLEPSPLAGRSTSVVQMDSGRQSISDRRSLPNNRSSSGPVSLIDHQALAERHTLNEKTWRDNQTAVRSSSLLLDAIIDRSFRDLYLLRSEVDGEEYYAAGVPWFATLFGRDSILAALQTLAFDPDIARQTLRVLAGYQGTQCDPWREEQPGKILHELRVGELARIKAIPHSPYYGTIDATPLFLILAAEYFQWTNDRATIDHLRPHITAALRWMNENQDEAGYLAYGNPSSGGLVNQGWKDSDNGAPNADGSPATPPVALTEVQAYAWKARRLVAHMLRRLGEVDHAETLEHEAHTLAERFERDFWMERSGCYALGLQQGGQQIRVCASNAGHVLWAGLPQLDRARRVRTRLMKPDMFSGWGIRTLSRDERAYSPVGYHVGTVWPHDNSLILAGFRRYGFDRAALRLFSGMTQAAMHFELYRLPELFAGFSRADYEVPVHYPLACKPQAWAAGAVPYMLCSLLGLQPEADMHRLNVVSPVLPDYTDWLELTNLRVGDKRVDLRFERTPRGVAVQVQHKDHDLEVVVRL